MSNNCSLSMAPEMAAITTLINTIDTVVDASAVILTDIHDTDLPAVETIVTANEVILTDIHDTDLPAVGVIATANEVILTDIHDTDLPAVQTSVDLLNAEIDLGAVAEMAQAAVNTDTYADVINITDKGRLTGISQECTTFTADGTAYLIITIDGTIIHSDPFLAFFAVGDHRSLAYHHKFVTSLRVQHKINAAAKGTVQTLVAHTIDAP